MARGSALGGKKSYSYRHAMNVVGSRFVGHKNDGCPHIFRCDLNGLVS
jgi:hypothetical protein